MLEVINAIYALTVGEFAQLLNISPKLLSWMTVLPYFGIWCLVGLYDSDEIEKAAIRSMIEEDEKRAA